MNGDKSNFKSDLRPLFRSLSKYEIPNEDETLQLIKEYKEGNGEAFKRILMGNMRLIIHIAKQYQYLGVEMSDLISEGVMGYIQAIKKFDPQRGAKLSTYATLFVRQKMQQSISKMGGPTSVPMDLSVARRGVARATNEFRNKFGREPTDDELNKKVNNYTKVSNRLKHLPKSTISINSRINHSDTNFEELLTEEKSPGREENPKGFDREDLSYAMKVLSERECRILSLRFGINDLEPHNLTDIAEELSLSTERIRQIVLEAIQKMRVHIARDGTSKRSKQAALFYN